MRKKYESKENYENRMRDENSSDPKWQMVEDLQNYMIYESNE